MNEKLKGMKVAILVSNGFEQVELEKPQKALEEAGAKTFIVSPEEKKVKGWQHTKWGEEFDVDKNLNNASPGNYDALVLPGGQMNPDNLRGNAGAVNFVKHFVDANKPIAAICHGPWTLIETGSVKGKNMTSYHTIQTDLKNAGANWEDKEVIVDGNWITSRKPDDIPAFNEKMVEVFSKHIPETAG